jgi:hypothetical protein
VDCTEGVWGAGISGWRIAFDANSEPRFQIQQTPDPIPMIPVFGAMLSK